MTIPIIGGFYRVNNKTFQVQAECQVKGYYICGILEDCGKPPFKSNRGQTITLQHTEHFSDFKDATTLKLVPMED